jgi:Ca-activated chloride channel family protein
LTRLSAQGGSAIREAAVQSIDWMKKAHREKHVLLVVTDGVDDASYVKLDGVMRKAQQSDVAIYAIGLLAGEEKSNARDARKQLRSLAEATGGEAFFPSELSDVERSIHQIVRHIHSQYTIGYERSNKALDGTFRRISHGQGGRQSYRADTRRLLCRRPLSSRRLNPLRPFSTG